MKENLLTIKNDLKEIAVELRSLKLERNKNFKSGQVYKAGSNQASIIDKKFTYRHMHIAYCLARGRNYSQVESKCRDNNEISKNEVKNYLEKYKLEALGDING